MIEYMFGVFLYSMVFCAHASVIYTYTGNNYTQVDGFVSSGGGLEPIESLYDTSMQVTGFIEFETALPPYSYAQSPPINAIFFDGINTFDLSDPTVLFNFFVIRTDSFGNIIEWNLTASDLDPQMFDSATLLTVRNADQAADWGLLYLCVDIACRTEERHEGLVGDNPGVWSVVPVPAALWLFGSGLIGLTGIARRKA